MGRTFLVLFGLFVGACAPDVSSVMVCPVGELAGCPCAGHATKWVSLIVAPAGTVPSRAVVTATLEGVEVGRAYASAGGAFALQVAAFSPLAGREVRVATGAGRLFDLTLPRSPAQSVLVFPEPGDGLDDSAGDIRLAGQLAPTSSDTGQPIARAWLVNVSTADIAGLSGVDVGSRVAGRVPGHDDDMVALVLRRADGTPDGCTVGANFGLMRCGCPNPDPTAPECLAPPPPDAGPPPTPDAGPPPTPDAGVPDADIDYGTVT